MKNMTMQEFADLLGVYVAKNENKNEIMVIYKNGINTFCRPREIFQEVVRADNQTDGKE